YNPTKASASEGDSSSSSQQPQQPPTPPIVLQKKELKKENIGILHFVANHFPDVDIIYKMTMPLPLDFPIRGQVPILLPQFYGASATSMGEKQVYAPYN